jgi:hypothetical protein
LSLPGSRTNRPSSARNRNLNAASQEELTEFRGESLSSNVREFGPAGGMPSEGGSTGIPPADQRRCARPAGHRHDQSGVLSQEWRIWFRNSAKGGPPSRFAVPVKNSVLVVPVDVAALCRKPVPAETRSVNSNWDRRFPRIGQPSGGEPSGPADCEGRHPRRSAAGPEVGPRLGPSGGPLGSLRSRKLRRINNRVDGYEPGGRRFESCRARQTTHLERVTEFTACE